jgi:hypothetical protein
LAGAVMLENEIAEDAKRKLQSSRAESDEIINVEEIRTKYTLFKYDTRALSSAGYNVVLVGNRIRVSCVEQVPREQPCLN